MGFAIILICITCTQAVSQIKKDFIITDYGADGRGQMLNTSVIQDVIDRASKVGGGRVIVPEGRFLTGTLELKSNVELHLEKNAVLLGSTNPVDYHALRMEGHPESPKKDDNSALALIAAFRAENIAITGPGTVDGQGTALALNIDSLYHIGQLKDPHYSTGAGRPNETVRPKLVLFSLCKHIDLVDATLKNSACWGLSFELCEKLILNRLTVVNRAYWNNDGTDITDCKNVRITDCDFNSADDGICLKSYYPGYSNDSFYIADCTVRSGASAIKFGTASYGGFKNVTINNIQVYDTYRSALAIETVDGADIENIKVTNIVAKNTGNAIFIRLGNRAGGRPGTIKNVNITNMKVQIPFGRPDINYDIRASEPGYHNPFPASITGIPGNNVQAITLENIEITYPGRASKAQAYFSLSRLQDFPEKINSYPEFSMFGEMPAWAFYIRHAENIRMRHITLKLADYDFRPAFIFDEVSNIELDGIKLPKDYQQDQIILKDCSDFQMKSSAGLKERVLP